MVDPTNTAAHGRLDRAGRTLVILGALVLGPLAVLFALGAAWFISYFGDDNVQSGAWPR